MDTSFTLTVSQLFILAIKKKASDIHMHAGTKPVFRIDNELVEASDQAVITKEFMQNFINTTLSKEQIEKLSANKVIRHVTTWEDKFRFRMNVHFQRGAVSLSIKLIQLQVPTLQDLGLPSQFQKLVTNRHGLIIISGPYNSGKTSTLAALLDEINKTRSVNIVTLEDPLEYIFINQKSIIEQRQIGRDVKSFVDGVNQCRHEDVDVVAISHTDDPSIFRPALELASSGKLVFMVMDSQSVIQSLQRIISAFPSNEMQKILQQLADFLTGVIALRLVPKIGGGRALAFGLLLANSSVRSIISDNRLLQLYTVMQSSQDEGMTTLDQQLFSLVSQNVITPETGIQEATDKNSFSSKMRR